MTTEQKIALAQRMLEALYGEDADIAIRSRLDGGDSDDARVVLVSMVGEEALDADSAPVVSGPTVDRAADNFLAQLVLRIQSRCAALGTLLERYYEDVGAKR